MSAYGLDCQSRRSKSCVVNDGSLSTEVLRVSIGYQSTRSKLFRFLFRIKENGLRTALRGVRAGPQTRTTVSTSHRIFQECDHNLSELYFKFYISTYTVLLYWTHWSGGNQTLWTCHLDLKNFCVCLVGYRKLLCVTDREKGKKLWFLREMFENRFPRAGGTGCVWWGNVFSCLFWRIWLLVVRDGILW